MTTSDPDGQPSREAHFRAVYEATYDDLLRFAQRRVHHSHAEDVAADTFLVAWRRLDEMPRCLDDARPWLFGVARATILNHRRGSGRRDALAVRLADATSTGYVDAGEDVVASRLDVATAWARLSDAEQETLGLTVWEGLSSAEAGVVLGCSPTAYRIRLSRARRSLRRHLDAATTPDHSAPPDATITQGPQR